MSIFKAYDIRGMYPEQLNEALAYKIGRAFVMYLQCRSVVVGYDMRKSSIALHTALVNGLTDQGANVTTIGLCTTPMLYYAASKDEAGIMITASHNPTGWNGMKLCGANVEPIGENNGLNTIKLLVEANQFVFARKGKLANKDIFQDYIQYFVKNLNRQKPMKIVLDTGNGMSGLTLPEFFRHTKHKIVHLFPDLDDRFPNHEANPLKTDTLEQLQKEVIVQKADFGIATDGDGDRCAFVDEKGELISADIFIAYLSEYILKNKSENIVHDLRTSKIVPETIIANRGRAIESRVGHSFVKPLMKKHNAFFGGELSGHFYYKDTFYAESVLYTIILLLESLSKTRKPLSQLVQQYKKYFQSGEINSDVKSKEEVFKKLKTEYKDAKLTTLDGLSIKYDTWWCNVRPSNTEPVMRLNLEADTEKELSTRTNQLLNIIRS